LSFLSLRFLSFLYTYDGLGNLGPQRLAKIPGRNRHKLRTTIHKQTGTDATIRII
jgi:hypothetical protein